MLLERCSNFRHAVEEAVEFVVDEIQVHEVIGFINARSCAEYKSDRNLLRKLISTQISLHAHMTQALQHICQQAPFSRLEMLDKIFVVCSLPARCQGLQFLY